MIASESLENTPTVLKGLICWYWPDGLGWSLASSGIVLCTPVLETWLWRFPSDTQGPRGTRTAETGGWGWNSWNIIKCSIFQKTSWEELLILNASVMSVSAWVLQPSYTDCSWSKRSIADSCSSVWLLRLSAPKEWELATSQVFYFLTRPSDLEDVPRVNVILGLLQLECKN